MKHSGNRSDFIDIKREELLHAYLESGGHRNFHSTESSRFWVSEERAAIVMSRMERGDSLDEMNKEKREMYRELHRRMTRLKLQKPQITSLQAMREIIYSPAPSFYIAAATAERVVKDMIRERRRKRLGLTPKSNHAARRKEELLKNLKTGNENE